jgi:hypothetical protein
LRYEVRGTKYEGGRMRMIKDEGFLKYEDGGMRVIKDGVFELCLGFSSTLNLEA